MRLPSGSVAHDHILENEGWNERTETFLICKDFLHGLYEDTFFLNHTWIIIVIVTVISTSVEKLQYTLKILHETVTNVHLFSPHVKI